MNEMKLFSPDSVDVNRGRMRIRIVNPLTLIGEPNEAIVKIEGQKFDSLIDSGAQISQLTESLVKALGLKIRNLKEILPLEGAAGIKVPYLGYVEA